MFGKTFLQDVVPLQKASGAPGTHLGGSRWSAASPISEETKIQISLALKGPNGPLSGVPRSPETIKLMRANHPHANVFTNMTLIDLLLFLSSLSSWPEFHQPEAFCKGTTSCRKEERV